MHHFRRDWLLPAVFAATIIAIAVVLSLAVFVVSRDRQRAKDDIAIERRARISLQNQIVFESYVLCRSSGRSKHDCRIIANGSVLKGKLNVKLLEAKVAQLGEAQVTKLFIGKDGTQVTSSGQVSIKGPPGPQGKQGQPGPQGAQGPAGPRGQTGSSAAKGAQGDTGARGAQGPAGPQGAKGDPGPQGPAGQGLTCPSGGAPTVRSLTIPSQGTFLILVCN